MEKTISLASGGFAAGTYTILIWATDENGHTAKESVNVNVREADNTAPTITVHLPAAGSTFQWGDEALIDAIIEDDKALAEIHIKVTLGTMVTIHEETITEFDEENYHQVEESAIVPDDAPFGTYKVTITATDAEGNQAVKTLTFQVVE